LIKSFWMMIKENKKLIKIATFIFTIGILFGNFIDPNNELIIESFEKLEGIAQEISENGSIFFTIKTIFINNIKVAIYMIVIGIIFGIYPIIILFFNGLFIGIFINMFVEQGQSIGALILGLLPHGIFELSAIILAAAYGMKLGFSLFKIFINKFKGKKMVDYKLRVTNIINETVVLIFGIAIILFVAAIIESTISMFIISNMNSF